MNSSFTRREALRGAALFGATTLLGGCRPASQTHHAPAIGLSGGDSLRFHAASAGLLYGCAVDVSALRSEADYAHLIRQQCSIIVPENCMKWAHVEPERGQLRFDDADFLIQFAEKNHIKMRGHTLVWHQQIPRWIDSHIAPSSARALLIDHVRTMCTRYSGRLHSWDVVNEAVDLKSGRPDGLRESLWLSTIGPGYVEAAFTAARTADPAALLTYNEYGIEDESAAHEEKRAAVLLLMRRLRARNIPVDAVGIQAHLRAGASSQEYGPGLRRFIAALRDLDLQVLITELDVDSSHAPPTEGQRDGEVVAATSAFLSTALATGNVRAVLTWGITTRHSWLKRKMSEPPSRGLPFDATLQPTPMFAALRERFDATRPSGATTAPVRPRRPLR